tara:strand:- start:1250 stop:1897 length:648 start_codon:yes stop_codon:yes gene_type:complete
MKGFLVTGTDTDVGKTWFMLKFGELLIKNKLKFHFLKPVESGCEEPNNNIIPKDATQFSILENVPLNKICRFMFKAYASPPRAAKMENKEIELKDIIDFIDKNKCNDKGCINIVEGCGGFYSPIAKNKLTSDLATELNLPIILVVKNTLGCINHTLLSIQSIENLGLEIKFIILNDTDKKIILDNFNELSNFTDIPIFRLGYNKEIDSKIINYIN